MENKDQNLKAFLKDIDEETGFPVIDVDGKDPDQLIREAIEEIREILDSGTERLADFLSE